MNNKKISIYYIMIHIMFWCGYAVSWSYTTVFLESRGYNSTQIGIASGAGALLSVICQPMLASLTKRIAWLTNPIIWLKVLTILTSVLMLINIPGFYTVMILFIVLLLVDASLPSVMSIVAMDANNNGGNINYGLARGCGSVAYAIFSLIIGHMLKVFGTNVLLTLYLFISVVIIAIVMLFQAEAKGLQAKKTVVIDDSSKGRNSNVLLKYKFLLPFLVATVLLYMAHGMINVFLINIIEAVGGNSTNLGTALAIAAVTELPVMALFVYIERKIPVEKLLIISAVFFTIKSFIALFSSSIAGIYVSQFFQFGGFALYTPASVYFMNKALDEQDRSLGQSLVGACSLGLGSTFGNMIGGVVLDNLGVKAVIMVAASMAVIAIFGMSLCNVYYKRKCRTR